MTEKNASNRENSFLRDIQALRADAKSSLEKGAVTKAYGGDADKAVTLLQTALAAEIVCVLRYTMHAISVQGINSSAVAEEFQEHADSERAHMQMIAERIDQLGGKPNFNPEGLSTRAATEYGNAETLVDMVKENLIAERIVIEHYLDLIRYFKDNDPTTRVMLEGILADEEDHATDMHDLLVAHEGKPMLND